MKIKKQYINLLYEITTGTEGTLTLAECRKRDTLAKSLAEHVKTFQKDKTKIFETYCKKIDGEPDTTGGRYNFEDENVQLVQNEYQQLIDEEVDLPDIEGIREILERTRYSPKVGEMEHIDSILSALDAPKKKKKK